MRFDGTQIATISAAGLALIGSVAAGFYSFADRNRELDIKLLKSALAFYAPLQKRPD
jgi:hypothetical protein